MWNSTRGEREAKANAPKLLQQESLVRLSFHFRSAESGLETC